MPDAFLNLEINESNPETSTKSWWVFESHLQENLVHFLVKKTAKKRMSKFMFSKLSKHLPRFYSSTVEEGVLSAVSLFEEKKKVNFY